MTNIDYMTRGLLRCSRLENDQRAIQRTWRTAFILGRPLRLNHYRLSSAFSHAARPVTFIFIYFPTPGKTEKKLNERRVVTARLLLLDMHQAF